MSEVSNQSNPFAQSSLGLSYQTEEAPESRYEPLSNYIPTEVPSFNSSVNPEKHGSDNVNPGDAEKKVATFSQSNSDGRLLEAIHHFSNAKDEILVDFRGKKLYVFLDYDGTLTPIVSDPWAATLPNHVRDLLRRISGETNRLVTVGIVTGRALKSVKNFVQITASEDVNFIYAASHGFHIEAAGQMIHHTVGCSFIPALQQAAAEIANAVRHICGVMLEDNEFAISVHYRNAQEGMEFVVEDIIDQVLANYKSLRKTRGKKVFELRINLDWDKGRAVAWLLDAMRVDVNSPDNRIVYIGDDITDEDAFQELQRIPNSLGILVSDQPDLRPTKASYYVESPSGVEAFLESLWECTRQN